MPGLDACEAVMIGLLWIRLGGGAFYGGMFPAREFPGDDERPVTRGETSGNVAVGIAIMQYKIAMVAITQGRCMVAFRLSSMVWRHYGSSVSGMVFAVTGDSGDETVHGSAGERPHAGGDSVELRGDVFNGNNLSRRRFMPRGDRTGPMGMGPMTGRGAGFCTGNGIAGFQNPMYGRGGGFGRGKGAGCGKGRGRMYGWGFGRPAVQGQPALAAPVDELSALKNQARYLEETLESVNNKIAQRETGEK